MDFKLVSKYRPTGDPAESDRQLVEGLLHGDKEQTLLELRAPERPLRWPT